MNGTAKLRVAVGVFHDIAKLRDAVDDLAVAGPRGGDVVLLCDSGAMNGLLDQATGPISDLNVHLLVRDSDNKTNPIQASLRDGGLVSNLSRDQILHFETWIDVHLADNLDQQLKCGGCLLLCPVLTAESEQSVSNVLLHHSSHPVQLHDIRPAG